MCTGRVDLSFVLRAFANGTDGVLIAGCWLGECHYLTNGNYEALSMMLICKRLLGHVGIDPSRLRLEFVSASQGSRFAEVVTDFTGRLKELGPIGIDRDGDGKANGLSVRLEAARGLVPYIKLVERERLRVRFGTEQEYLDFFNSDEVNRIYGETIGEELTSREILLLLRERRLTTEEIASMLNLSRQDVSRHLGRSVKQGLVRFDGRERSFALAQGNRRDEGGR
jgi:F420-non-reducing hydrogenase iron-sulfur subunit